MSRIWRQRWGCGRGGRRGSAEEGYIGAVAGRCDGEGRGGRAVLVCDYRPGRETDVSCRRGGIRLNFRTRNLGAGWIKDGGETKRPSFNSHKHIY